MPFTDKWECEYSCILFDEQLHVGTFKKIHRAVIGTHSVVVKTLKSQPEFVYIYVATLIIITNTYR